MFGGRAVAVLGAALALSCSTVAPPPPVLAGPIGECEPPPAPPPPPPPAPASRVDTTRLGEAFADIGYTPPDNAHLLVGREIDGASGQFEWFSLGESGFAYSDERYWPASTVKLIAAVAAFEALEERGLTGAVQLTFEDEDGPYSGTARWLAEESVRVSSNIGYNRTVLIAGFDELNDEILPRWGLRNTVLQRRYTRPPGVTEMALRRSPRITFREGVRRGVIPERVGAGRHPECPAEGNCTTLYELLSVLRRVVLHRELPSEERFRIDEADAEALRRALYHSRSRLALGAEAALGPVRVWNKTGTVPGDERLDHGLVEDVTTGRRYLVALAMKQATTTNGDAQELTRQALLAIRL